MDGNKDVFRNVTFLFGYDSRTSSERLYLAYIFARTHDSRRTRADFRYPHNVARLYLHANAEQKWLSRHLAHSCSRGNRREEMEEVWGRKDYLIQSRGKNETSETEGNSGGMEINNAARGGGSDVRRIRRRFDSNYPDEETASPRKSRVLSGARPR